MLSHRRIWSILFVFFCFTSKQLFAQVKPPEIIQLSGIITDASTMFPIAYSTVVVPSDYRGVNASADGFFSIVVKRGDTLQFSALGYKPKLYVVPDSGTDNIESIAVKLENDTLLLEEFVVYPWPSKDEFREAFLAYQANQEYTIGPLPGLRRPWEIDTVPKAPNPIMNPISFIYDEVVKPIQWKKKKRDMVDKLPVWEQP
jgi:hypothetical protein